VLPDFRVQISPGVHQPDVVYNQHNQYQDTAPRQVTQSPLTVEKSIYCFQNSTVYKVSDYVCSPLLGIGLVGTCQDNLDFI